MQYRIFGLILLAAAVLIMWYFTPTRDGKLRYPARFQKHIGTPIVLLVVVLIGLAVPLILFGAPGMSFTGAPA
jgi:hypothetical protein